MSENPRSREHVHPVCLPAAHYIGVAKLMGNLEISKPAAVLLVINEGLHCLGALSDEDYKLLDSRYRRPLKSIIAERQNKREPSHVPVLAIEKAKAEKPREHKDYSSLPLEELQKLYDAAHKRLDPVEPQLILFEFKKRGIKPKEAAI